MPKNHLFFPPCLGRNRELQGLAMAMTKLWESSAIAKIAIKRGVLNTSNERMAEELKVNLLVPANFFKELLPVLLC